MRIVPIAALACLAVVGIAACAASPASLRDPASSPSVSHALSAPVVVDQKRWQDVSVKVVTDGAQMTVAKDGSLLYVTDNAGNALVVVDARTHQVVKIIHGGDSEAGSDGCPHNFCRGMGATGVALSPTGDSVYVSSLKADTFSKIDLHSGKVVAEVKVGRFPRDVVVSLDGRRAYVMNSVDDSVSAVDLDTMTSSGAPLKLAGDGAANLPFGRYLGIWLSPDGDRLLVKNATSGLVDAFDTRRLQQAGAYRLNLGVSTVAANPKAERVAIADDLGVSILSSKTMGLQTRLSFNCNPMEQFGGGGFDHPTMAWSDDGRHLAVHPSQSDIVWVVDTADGEVVRRFPLADGTAYSMVFSPSGDMLYILDGSGSVHFADMSKTLAFPTDEDESMHFCKLVQYLPEGESALAPRQEELPPPPPPSH